MAGDIVQAVQQVAEQHQDQDGTEQPQLFANDGKDHIVLRFRDRGQLLRTVAQPFSEQAARTDRIQGLHDLVAAGGKIVLRLQPCQDTPNTEIRAAGDRAVDHKEDARRSGPHRKKQENERPGPRMRQEDQQHADRQDDQGRTQVIRKHIGSQRLHQSQQEQQKDIPEMGDLLSHTHDQKRDEQDDRDLGDLRRLKGIRSDLQPAGGAVDRSAERAEADGRHGS